MSCLKYVIIFVTLLLSSLFYDTNFKKNIEGIYIIIIE